MTQTKLRLFLYLGWVGSLLISVFLLLLGPAVRGDESLGYEQVFAVIPAVIGLHLPALSTFAAFWFPQEERARARASKLNRERAFGAISLTFVYLLVVLAVVAWPTLVIDYTTSPGVDIPPGESFASRINDAVKISLMLSPVALAPSAYVTRLAPSTDAKTKKRTSANAGGNAPSPDTEH